MQEIATVKRITMGLLLSLLLTANAQVIGAQAIEPPTSQAMTNEKLGNFLLAIDPNLQGRSGNWQLKIREFPAYVISDQAADRMRVVIPIAPVNDIDRDQLYRIMQANFESALDARYAIADNLVWSAYIHPLSSLDNNQLASALAQTYNAASTFGEGYTSGLFSFGGGDNRPEIFDEIIEKGLSL